MLTHYSAGRPAPELALSEDAISILSDGLNATFGDFQRHDLNQSLVGQTQRLS